MVSFPGAGLEDYRCKYPVMESASVMQSSKLRTPCLNPFCLQSCGCFAGWRLTAGVSLPARHSAGSLTIHLFQKRLIRCSCDYSMNVMEHMLWKHVNPNLVVLKKHLTVACLSLVHIPWWGSSAPRRRSAGWWRVWEVCHWVELRVHPTTFLNQWHTQDCVTLHHEDV